MNIIDDPYDDREPPTKEENLRWFREALPDRLVGEAAVIQSRVHESEYERVVYPIGNLTGDAADAANRALDRSMTPVTKDERHDRRADFERARDDKQRAALAARIEEGQRMSYCLWMARRSRSRYSPNLCQAQGKR